MAKVISLFKFKGSVGDITFFENEYGPQAKMKGGPSAWQVAHLEQFANTRRNAAEWKRATAASRLLRVALGSMRHSVKNIRLSGRMNALLLAALKADPIHGRGERLVSSGDLSVLTGFEFNHRLSLEDALPLNIENYFSVEAGKVMINIPAFRLRKKKGLPADATHYRLVSCMLTIDFDNRRYQQDKQAGPVQAMGRQAGEAFCIEHTVRPTDEQGCFWLMGIEFYKLVNDRPVLVKGGALRVMQWMGKVQSKETRGPKMEVVEEAVAAHAAAPAGIEVEVADIIKTTASPRPVVGAARPVGAVVERDLALACSVTTGDTS